MDAPALASHPRATRRRSVQQLSQHDAMRLEAFFLALDFDQRRCHFGGGLSDSAVLDYCRRIDWRHTKVIARTGAYCLDAAALISDIPLESTMAELSVICPLHCDRSDIIGDLLDHVTAAAAGHRELIVYRDFAIPELIHLVRERMSVRSTAGEIRIRLTPERAGDR